MSFERAEFEQRYARLQRALERDNLDALLVTHETNFNYFGSGTITKTSLDTTACRESRTSS